MIGLKIAIFLLTVISVRYIFIYIVDVGDKKINKMKELIDFADYLKIYSCDMKMSLDEIVLKYNYKSESLKMICQKFSDEIKNESIVKTDKKDLLNFIEKTILTPMDFNSSFVEIIDYYGSTYSEVLNRKLNFTIGNMSTKMEEYEESHKEKKELYNKVSVLLGCLMAIILI
ncbi:hypothetical protein J2Z76_001290 [Sedimentibacter acidaminivorans]|uniref:Stage III sporulation protein AB n=1 Tax=Sedimentibacter acidaminivorans TaxID=913099 RepID=A0ABS4GCN1_9FIRM|nr:hypothetical protein [Sedimentibacter acidaminivorans]MBP1925431.1 hypothetical protein [Sedimentibacter acidaminivorans]